MTRLSWGVATLEDNAVQGAEGNCRGRTITGRQSNKLQLAWLALHGPQLCVNDPNYRIRKSLTRHDHAPLEPNCSPHYEASLSCELGGANAASRKNPVGMRRIATIRSTCAMFAALQQLHNTGTWALERRKLDIGR